MNLPLVILINVLFAWHLSPEDSLGIGIFFSKFFPWDFVTAKAATNTSDIIGGFATMGFVYGVGATNVAHELVEALHHSPLACCLDQLDPEALDGVVRAHGGENAVRQAAVHRPRHDPCCAKPCARATIVYVSDVISRTTRHGGQWLRRRCR